MDVVVFSDIKSTCLLTNITYLYAILDSVKTKYDVSLKIDYNKNRIIVIIGGQKLKKIFKKCASNELLDEIKNSLCE